MPSAINFDGHNLNSNRPIGIDVATREFLTAYFKHNKQNYYYCVCPDEDAFSLFKDYAREQGIKDSECIPLNQNDSEGLQRAQCLLRYDPSIVRNAWLRRYHGENKYSLCGLLHSVASEQAMELIGSYMMAPFRIWDALICPSQAIKGSAQTIFDQWEFYLNEKFGITYKLPIELPVIPLGVDSEKFKKLITPKDRNTQRERLGIQSHETVLLYVGRLNFLTKANILPMLIAAEEATRDLSSTLHILFYGYFNDKVNENAFREAFKSMSRQVKISYVKHGDTSFPTPVWAAADIFCSIPDNIQESFGLTPLEAMACGLPVIVSDWNGYKETVEDGIEGLTIPTLLPDSKNGKTIGYRYFSKQYNYGDYLGSISQSTVVDIPKLTKAITLLANNKEKRKTMGNAGQKKAANIFDWSKIVPLYVDLFRELTNKRLSETPNSGHYMETVFNPSRPHPHSMYTHYSTMHLSGDGRVELSVNEWKEIQTRIELKMGLIIPDTLIPLEDLPKLISIIEELQTPTVSDLYQFFGEYSEENLIMTIGWLTKIGILRYYPQIS